MNHICWNCKEMIDIDLQAPMGAAPTKGGLPKDVEDGKHIICHCGEVNVIMGNRTISTDEAYEGLCESQEAARIEEQHYGGHDE